MSGSLRLSNSQVELWEQTNARYEAAMTREAASWLTARGIDKEAAVGASLGVVPNDPILGHERFVGMISIPYKTKYVPVVGWKFRNLTSHGPKYDGPSGQPGRLYGVHTLRPADTVLVCEGELDAVLAHRVTGLPAVGVPGASAWKKHYSRVLEGYRRVLVLADNDAGKDRNVGRELGKKICESIPQAQAVDLPPGDLTDFVVAGGDLKGLIAR